MAQDQGSKLLQTNVFIDIQPEERIRDLPQADTYAAGVETPHIHGGRGIVLVFDDAEARNLHAIGAFHKGKRQGTWDTGYTVTDLVLLDGHLSLDQLAALFPPQWRERHRQSLRHRGSLTDAAGRAALEALMTASPELRPTLQYLARYPDAVGRYSAERQSMLALERESLGLSLDLAGLPRDMRLKWEPVAQDAPFITGYANEVGMANFDMEWFDGIRSDTHPAELNARVFQHPRAGRLVVANYDKTRVESALGLDLVYYHVNRASYVCVQYKRMTKMDTGWAYYETDQLAKQLAAMDGLATTADDSAVSRYRLNPDPFYFKLTKVSNLDLAQRELLPGMYLPRTLLKLLRKDPKFLTPHGNLHVGWDGKGGVEPPYITNTDFTTLFREGMIGSSGATTDTITEIIRNSLSQGNNAMLAMRDR